MDTICTTESIEFGSHFQFSKTLAVTDIIIFDSNTFTHDGPKFEIENLIITDETIDNNIKTITKDTNEQNPNCVCYSYDRDGISI